MGDNAIRMKNSQWIALDSSGLYGIPDDTVPMTIQEMLTAADPTWEIPEQATAVRVYAQVTTPSTGNIVVLEYGVPTTGEGLLLSNGTFYDIEGRVNIDRAKFLLAGGTTVAAITMQFYK